jgi:putative two-component system response regulator
VEALDLLKTHSPLAILLDVNMPQMDGFTLLARLKADPGTRDIPVLMLTAQSAPADIQRAIQLGARDYIGKPFETRQLLRRVDRMLHA